MTGKKKRPWNPARKVEFSESLRARKLILASNFRRLVAKFGIDYKDLAKNANERRIAIRIYENGISRGGDNYLARFCAAAGIDNYRRLYDPDLFDSLETKPVRHRATETPEPTASEAVNAPAPSPAGKPEGFRKLYHDTQAKVDAILNSGDHALLLVKLVDSIYADVRPRIKDSL